MAKVAREMADSAVDARNRRDPNWFGIYELDAVTEDHDRARGTEAVRAEMTRLSRI